MAEKSSEGCDYWAAVDVLRHELERRSSAERRANERHVYVRKYGGDLDAALSAWRATMQIKSDAYRAYMAAFKAALESGQPMPECGCD